MTSVKSGEILAAVVATGVAASAYFWWNSTGNKENSRKEDEDEEIEVPDLSREIVVKFFEVVNFEMAAMATRFGQQIAQFRGKVPDQQLTELATSNFESHLGEIQEQILTQFRVSAEDMEDASGYYAEAGDKEVLEGMKRLKSTYLAIAGAPLDEVGGVPEGLTAEKMVEVVKVYFDASMEATRSVLEGLKAQGKRLTDTSTVIEMNLLYQKQSEKGIEAALKRFKLDATTFQVALEKFSDNPAVQNAVKAATEEQQNLLTTFEMR